MKRPWEILDEEVLPYLAAERLYADLRGLRQDGKLWQACCPIHGDKEGAFSVDPTRLEWNCFLGCGGGGPVQYLQKVRGLSWIEAARELMVMAGLDPSLLDPWREEWTDHDFYLHERLENRASLLRVFMARARSVLHSQAGQTVRTDLVKRIGFSEDTLRTLDVGLYTAPEDVWHYLKKTGRDLENVRTWGLFEARWAGCVVGSWNDLRGRTVNVWGYQPRGSSSKEYPDCFLFEQDDPLDGMGVPFHLDAAVGRENYNLLMLEDPLEALCARSLGLDDPFPVACGGDLTSAQIEVLQDYLGNGGSLTLSWDFDPPSTPTRKDKTVTALERLKKARFAVYSVDPSLLADPRRPKQKVSLCSYLLRNGGGGHTLASFHDLFQQREAQIVVQGEFAPQEESNWPAIFQVFGSLASARSRRDGKESTAVGGVQVLEPLLQMAEEFGRRLASGFMKTLPRGLTSAWTEDSLDNPQLGAGHGTELRRLSSVASSAPTFSVRRLEEEARATPRGHFSGWPALDDLECRFDPGELAVVASRTGHGKTSILVGLLSQWLRSTSGEQEEPLFVFYSMEEPEVRIYHRLLSLLTAAQGQGWSIREIQEYFQELPSGPNGGSDPRALAAARERMRAWEPQLEIVFQPAWTVAEIESHARNLSRSRQLGAVFVDHLQALTPGSGGHGGVGVATAMRHLKSLAGEMSCPVVVASGIESRAVLQNRPIPKRASFEDGEVQRIIKMRRPQLKWLRERCVEREADLILGVLNYAAEYRTEVGETGSIPDITPCEVGTLKNRYGPVGSWAWLSFDGRFGLLRDPSAEVCAVAVPH